MPSIQIGSRALRRAVIALYFLAVVVLHGTLFWIGHGSEPRLLVGDEPMYLKGAMTLLAGETWHFESLWPPFQAVFLAGILWVSDGSLLGVEIVQSLLLGLVALLLGDFTRAVTGSRIAALVSGGLVLVYPHLGGYAHFMWPEVLHMFTLVATGWIFVRKRGGSRAWIVVAGILFGITLCSKYLIWPYVLLVLPVVLVRAKRSALGPIAVFAASAVLVVSLIYSNERLKIRAYPMVESAAFNAWVGLNDHSRKDFVDPIVGQYYQRYMEMPSVRERNASMWSEIFDKIRNDGVAQVVWRQANRQYFRLFDKDSFFTDQLPGGVIAASGVGYRQTPAGVTRVLRVWSYGLYALILVGTVAGTALFPRQARRWSHFFLSFLAYAMLVFLISHVKSRFRVQLLPIFFVYCGCTVAWFAAWLGARFGWNGSENEIWTRRPGRAGWTGVVAVSGLLLFLAFGRGWV